MCYFNAEKPRKRKRSQDLAPLSLDSGKAYKILISSFLLLIFSSYQLVFAQNLINYIYIESNEGNSSGGHAALQFDNDVYHYQYTDPGVIRLQKQDAENFEYDYRFAANRSLHTSQIDVTKETYSSLRDYFNLQHQTQQQQFKALDDLRKDQVLLQSFLSGVPNSALRLKGAGLFYENSGFLPNQSSNQNIQDRQTSPTIIALNNVIKKKYGKAFLSQRISELIQKIKSLQPTQWQKSIATVNDEQYPRMVYSFANQYMDLMTAVFALQVIEQGLRLREDAYIVPPNRLFELKDEELANLRLYRKQLEEGLVKLVNSKRPDYGYALLVNVARLIAIDTSIIQKKLIVIDTFDSNADIIDGKDFSKYTEQLQRHLSDTYTRLINTKLLLTQKKAFNESNYSALEMLVNRYTELSKAMTGNQEIRFYGANLVPTKSIVLPLLIIPEWSKEKLDDTIKKLSVYQEQYQETLKKLYPYHLIIHNCVTELFRSIDKALMRQIADSNPTIPLIIAESTQRLGGYVDTAKINFIPVISNDAVRNHYRVIKQTVLPSFRLMKLNELYMQRHDLLVYLTENNTFSSTLYKHNSDDSFFIFFTDDDVLLRPVYGAVNTLAGIGQSLLGLFAWPYDSGDMLRAGGSGVLMSLPELLFVNMRKGSFKYLPYSHLSTTKPSLSNWLSN